MFCPKCGAQMPEETQLCSNCGCDISNIQQAVPSEKVLTMDGVQSVELERKSSPIRTIFFILATIVFALSLYSAHCVAAGGLDIASIQSVGGKTLEDAYYQYLGTVYAGYASMIRTTGLFFSAILIYIGMKG